MPQNQKSNGLLIYEGLSLIDQEPIVCIITGFMRNWNRKTGNMLQSWILCQNISPVDAVKSGRDSSICGECPLRGDGLKNRSCYVQYGQAPAQIWRSYKRSLYPRMTSLKVFHGKKLRLGSYAEPTAVPLDVWIPILDVVDNHTGYTHLWKTCNQLWKKYLMASVESYEGYLDAKSMGWRTFRIRKVGEKLYSKEFDCPASTEQHNRLDCASCMACNGGDGRKADPSIVVHGRQSIINAFYKLPLGV